MKTGYAEICRLIAASGFREHEISEFARVLLRVGQEAFLAHIINARSSPLAWDEALPFDSPSRRYTTADAEVIDKVERLLIRDTKLPRSTAVELLSREIGERFPNLKIPAESRKGFHAWIRRLMTLLPERELLHIVTIIRNRFVHDDPADWRLK